MDHQTVLESKRFGKRDLEKEANKVSLSLKQGSNGEDGIPDRSEGPVITASRHWDDEEYDLVWSNLTPG